MVDYSLYPICDTNIFINLRLGNVLNEFLTQKIKIYVADKVKDEMNNKFSISKKYNFLLDIFEKDNIELIEESIFSEDEKRVMSVNLASYKIQNFIGKRAWGKDAGEFASALYAINLNIKKLYTDDKKFIRDYGQEAIFSSLEMINLNCALEEFLEDSKRISVNSKIESENKKMNYILKKEYIEKEQESENAIMDNLLDRLVKKFS